MKSRMYLRIAKDKGTKFQVAVSKKPIFEPLFKGSKTYNSHIYLPTVQMVFDVEIPDEEFDKSRILLQAKIKTTEPCIEIKQVEAQEKENEKEQ